MIPWYVIRLVVHAHYSHFSNNNNKQTVIRSVFGEHRSIMRFGQPCVPRSRHMYICTKRRRGSRHRMCLYAARSNMVFITFHRSCWEVVLDSNFPARNETNPPQKNMNGETKNTFTQAHICHDTRPFVWNHNKRRSAYAHTHTHTRSSAYAMCAMEMERRREESTFHTHTHIHVTHACSSISTSTEPR